MAALYNGRLAEYGYDVRTVGWGSAESQRLRFAVLCRGLSLRGARILDLGCGLGDLVPWLETYHGDDFDYTGLDLSADLVVAAAARHGGARRRFLTGTLSADLDVGRLDLILLSGTLTFRTHDNVSTMRSLLALAFERCDGAVCANFLSSYADHELQKNFHFAPEVVFAYAKTLTPYVALHHDYPLLEFTVQLFRHPHP